MTLAELDVLAKARRLEDWERAAFVANFALHANPFLTRGVVVRNPYRENEQETTTRVPLENVAALN